jgi:hypothetical protein
MCDPNSGSCPFFTRSMEMSSSGSDEAVDLVLGEVVCVQAASSVWDELTLMARVGEGPALGLVKHPDVHVGGGHRQR